MKLEVKEFYLNGVGEKAKLHINNRYNDMKG